MGLPFIIDIVGTRILFSPFFFLVYTQFYTKQNRKKEFKLRCGKGKHRFLMGFHRHKENGIRIRVFHYNNIRSCQTLYSNQITSNKMKN